MMKLKPIGFLVILTNESHSRPISYSGGWTIMQMNNLNTIVSICIIIHQ